MCAKSAVFGIVLISALVCVATVEGVRVNDLLTRRLGTRAAALTQSDIQVKCVPLEKAKDERICKFVLDKERPECKVCQTDHTSACCKDESFAQQIKQVLSSPSCGVENAQWSASNAQNAKEDALTQNQPTKTSKLTSDKLAKCLSTTEKQVTYAGAPLTLSFTTIPKGFVAFNGGTPGELVEWKGKDLQDRTLFIGTHEVALHYSAGKGDALNAIELKKDMKCIVVNHQLLKAFHAASNANCYKPACAQMDGLDFKCKADSKKCSTQEDNDRWTELKSHGADCWIMLNSLNWNENEIYIPNDKLLEKMVAPVLTMDIKLPDKVRKLAPCDSKKKCCFSRQQAPEAPPPAFEHECLPSDVYECPGDKTECQETVCNGKCSDAVCVSVKDEEKLRAWREQQEDRPVEFSSKCEAKCAEGATEAINNLGVCGV